MSSEYLFLILFIYYGGIETAGEFLLYPSMKKVFRSASAVSVSGAFTGLIYFLLIKNISQVLQFMALPLTFIVLGWAVSRLFSLRPAKIMFSSFAAVMIFILPESAGGFFAGLLAGCAGFIISCIVIYRISRGTKESKYGSLPAVLIIASVISMIAELFLK